MQPSQRELVELLGYLTPEEREQLDALLADVPVWTPFEGPQMAAYTTDADEIGYGGSAGGGKTDLAIGFALTKHYVSAIFRKNGTEHTAIVDRVSEILGSRDGFNGSLNIWRFDANRQLEFCSVPNPGDEKKYQGRPHDLIVFDEATNIPFNQITFLKTWLRPARTTLGETRCRVLYTFNPPTSAEGRWVIEYFAPWLDEKHPNPATPGELRWFAMIDGRDTEVKDGVPFTHNGEVITPKSRTFIPARVTDNPVYRDSGYMATLQALPEPLRSQMLYGDFKAGVVDDPWQVIPTAWVEAAMARWTMPARLPEMMNVGVDVARGGRDATVIARKHHGLWFDKPLRYPGAQTPDGPTTAGLVIAATRDQAPIAIDVIGVGSSPYDFLRQSGQQVYGVNVAEAATETDKTGRLTFANIRTQLWWKMRELLDPSANTGIALPPDKELLADLCAPTWSITGRAVRVESREDIIDRIGRSPDVGTAYVLAAIDIPKRRNVGVHRDRARSYDVFANILPGRR